MSDDFKVLVSPKDENADDETKKYAKVIEDIVNEPKMKTVHINAWRWAQDFIADFGRIPTIEEIEQYLKEQLLKEQAL